MKQYKYTGDNPFYKGRTALGQQTEHGFVVQLDDLSHPHAIGWHKVDPNEWSRILILDPFQMDLLRDILKDFVDKLPYDLIVDRYQQGEEFDELKLILEQL